MGFIQQLCQLFSCKAQLMANNEFHQAESLLGSDLPHGILCKLRASFDS